MNANAKELLDLLKREGIPLVLAAILLSVFLGWVSSPLTEARDLLRSHIQQVSVEQAERQTLLRELVTAQRATCVALAQTQEIRERCLR